ncbi:MAG: mannose-1-phosphate guanylyltransferase [Spirochaetes bacterium]|nr:mannose-1-phosphate guanylyltransferase [Spirochaetota bacterium]
MKITPVILAGGGGTRLWPLSREDKPKQFHDLTGEGTLLEATINRLLPLNPDICIIATSGSYEKLSKQEIKKTGLNGIVLVEPMPKNTAPAILYSAFYLSKIYDDAVMIVLPADHYIKRNEIFIETIRTAVKEAEKDFLVTIGIKPESPETGYGYIKAGKTDGNVFSVESFVEKPDKKTAEKYLQDGNYFWNAGIFIWKVSVILKSFKDLMPDLYNSFIPLMTLKADRIASCKGRDYGLKEKIFSSVEAISIDYGIMEKAERKVVIPADFGWTDLGSWNSIDEIILPDKNNNRCPDKGNSIFVSSNNCSVFSEGKTIALVGVENLVVVESANNILVINKNSNQEVRKVVDIVKSRTK